jgi:S-adenosylmethionine:tRNA ribosyltransferase-isomerase
MSQLALHPSIRFGGSRPRFASAPAELTQGSRDAVRLLVVRPDGIRHRRFPDLIDALHPGDALVVNTSAVVNAEIDAVRGRTPVVLHLAGELDDGSWVVELRSAPDAARAVLDASPGEVIQVGDLAFTLVSAYPATGSPSGVGNRLWRAIATGSVRAVFDRRSRPIAYGYLSGRWPLVAYQTVFSRIPGSAEMASAGRPFTTALVRALITRGIHFAPVVLHTGVSSQEAGEPPQPERFEVPASTADLLNQVRNQGGRVVAVGTTATRAVESAVVSGRVVPRTGWTERIITPGDGPRIVTGLITGWHDAQASHLLLVEAVAGHDLTQRAYDAALAEGYAWHEFGDSGLFLPEPAEWASRP